MTVLWKFIGLILLFASTLQSRVKDFIREYPWNQELVAGIEDYEVVYPFQLRERNRVGIDTRSYYYTNGTYHHDSATFVIRFGRGKRFKMHLRRNQELIPKKAKLRKVLKNRRHQEIKAPPENCYYQGRLHSQRNSLVALSSCTGLKGVIFTERETWEIHPLRGGDLGKRHPHVLFKAGWKKKVACANSHNTEWSSSMERKRTHGRRRLKRDTKTSQKYTEIGVVVDYGLSEMLDFKFSSLLPYVLETVNIIDLIYQHNLNTRVSLVFLEAWTEGTQMTITDNIIPTMLNFLDYVTRDLYHVHKDLTLFLTSHRFSKKQHSLSTSRSVCTARASGIVSSESKFQSLPTAMIMSHTLGHILGMEHDDALHPPCPCTDPRGCGMLKQIGHPKNGYSPEISQCAKDAFLDTLDSGAGRCLFNKPLEPGTLGRCGNREIDEGEECDCGSIEECDKVDRCCDPVTCKLKSHAECASGPCCNDCKLKRLGTLCRNSTNECDVPEVCDGKVGQCPRDARTISGTECAKGKGFCYMGICTTPDYQCQDFWGSQSKKAESECFQKFNVAGSFNGHCGFNGKGEYKKCEPVNTECGLLHCQGGRQSPYENKLDITSTFMISHVGRDDDRIKCKIVTGTKGSLVNDGSKCGVSGVCLGGACVPMADILPPARCPTNNAALHCSGHGVCSTHDWCYCDPGYTGSDCSIRDEHYQNDGRNNMKGSRKVNVSETTSVQETEQLNTVSMLVILGGVIGGVFVLMLFLLLCYRRRTNSTLRKKKLAAKAVQEFDKYSESSFDTAQRSIKFGSMPSYRDEKRKQKRILHKINEVQDERDSISNRSRESGERSIVAMNNRKAETYLSVEQRGILKQGEHELSYPLLPNRNARSPGAESDSQSAYRIFERSLRKLEEYEYANPYHTPITSQGIGVDGVAPVQTSPQSEYWGGVHNGGNSRSKRQVPQLAVFSPQPTRSGAGQYASYVYAQDGRNYAAPSLRSARGGYATDTEVGYTPRSSRRRPSFEPQSNRSSAETDTDRKVEASPPRIQNLPNSLAPGGYHDPQSSAATDRTSPTNSVASSKGLGKPQPLKLRNIEYLLKQLDTPRSGQSTSPTSSAEFSAPEADTHSLPHEMEDEHIEEAGSNTESHRDTVAYQTAGSSPFPTFHPPTDPPNDSPSANFHNQSTFSHHRNSPHSRPSPSFS